MTPTHRIALAVPLLLAPALCAGQAPGAEAAPAAEAAAPVAAQPPLLPRNDLPGLQNFGQVSEALYRGAQPTAEGFKQLKQLGVKTVVNLRVTASDREAMAGLGLQHLELSFKPWHPEFEDLAPFLKLFEDSKNLPVFVHCKHGSDRTGTVVALYRMVHQGWTRERAIAELPRFGFHEIWGNLRDYLKVIEIDALKAAIAAEKPTALEKVP